MKKLLLIDGHALIFRSYYAFLRRPMINSKGVDTSILFGFTKTLIELIIKERPSHLAVAFDPPAKTFRHEIYPQYKANRKTTPELVKEALEPLCNIMDAISVPVLMRSGFEADDVIGTIASRAAKENFTVYMVTPDKDLGQLVSEDIYQLKPGRSGADNELVGKKDICALFGITDPKQIIDILTIWGDTSDNVPGVKGIGEVGAKKLINRYHSIANIYTSLSQLPEKQKIAFEEAMSYIELSRKLITINTNVDIEWNEEELRLATPGFDRLKGLFTKYEFTSLNRYIPLMETLFDIKTSASEAPAITAISNDISLIKTTLGNVVEYAAKEKEVSLKLINGKLMLSSSGYYTDPFDLEEQRELVSALINDKNISKIGYELKIIINLLRERGIQMRGRLYDIELMHYLLTPERSHKIDILANSYLNIEITESQNDRPICRDLFSSSEEDNGKEIDRAVKELLVISLLKNKLEAELEVASIANLYHEVEMPLIYVLADMEFEGIKVDTARLDEYRMRLSAELITIEASVREMADEPALNVSSPKQLGVVLYEKLKITGNVRKTSGKNYSTDEETLSGLIDAHPIIPQILEYRNIKKLLSTYIDPLPSLISPKDYKLHTTYNQASTSTGRLSSVRPNLQNIPIRTERGKEIRRAFISSHKNGVIISADYSQIELRLMAHISGDPDFIAAFIEGKDVHTATAAKIFGIPEQNVTKEQRNKAKVANFGIIYGISAFGLSQRLRIPRAEAKKLIEDYFSIYPQVERYMNEMTVEAKRKGFVSTLYGRKRYIPDIDSANTIVRGMAERNAINAPIQGSAADIIKVAMVRLFNRIRKEGFRSKMVLQVHDELVFDAYEDEAERLSVIIREEMEGVILLSVPLTIECQQGTNWLEAH